MSSAARIIEVEPNHPEVERAYANAAPTVVAEILRGNLMMSPRPAAAHGRAAKRLGILLGAPFDLGNGGPGGWIFIDEPELNLGARPDKMQPDLAAWRRERLPRSPRSAVIGVAPDWVCEVLSASTEVNDRGVKVPLYAEHGVEHVWLIDPAERVLEAFVREGLSYRATGSWRGDVSVRVAPFDALTLDLALVWQW